MMDGPMTKSRCCHIVMRNISCKANWGLMCLIFDGGGDAETNTDLAKDVSWLWIHVFVSCLVVYLFWFSMPHFVLEVSPMFSPLSPSVCCIVPFMCSHVLHYHTWPPPSSFLTCSSSVHQRLCLPFTSCPIIVFCLPHVPIHASVPSSPWYMFLDLSFVFCLLSSTLHFVLLFNLLLWLFVLDYFCTWNPLFLYFSFKNKAHLLFFTDLASCLTPPPLPIVFPFNPTWQQVPRKVAPGFKGLARQLVN